MTPQRDIGLTVARRVLKSVVAPALRVSVGALIAAIPAAACGCGRSNDAPPIVTSEAPPPPAPAPTPAPSSSATGPTPATNDAPPAPVATADTTATATAPTAHPRVRRPPPGVRYPKPGPPVRHRPGPPAEDPFDVRPGAASYPAELADRRSSPGPRPSRGARRRTDPDRTALLAGGRSVLA